MLYWKQKFIRLRKESFTVDVCNAIKKNTRNLNCKFQKFTIFEVINIF